MKNFKSIATALLLTMTFSAGAFAHGSGGTLGGNLGIEMCKIGAINCGFPKQEVKVEKEAPKAEKAEVKEVKLATDLTA
ncbi:hypothetical protein KVP40.0263 [Vibrio phage KVP40]|uniref:Uncharacterized protein n=3 Tax=Schizotequatrovirus KVP40 TaxID=1914019 RepID=Q6WHP1_BPKVM|nr:hypothetical protein KVP40.0263 [Vibrio phage KVP40]QHJ74442.1 hypothetical protein VH12019_00115 [Vibrio phage VH1_2019]QIW90163.1 hypothetical protein OLCHANIL_00066 [Vibrio phage V05]QIW91152.1 hypothetical protein COHAPHLL_00316 [Vibrio phage V09]UNA01775.1 hypothetical protein [Vibrio phage PC-Liy1]URQ03071.1 hypothetical protein PVA8_85 [Vibrio phage PVA8]WBM58807.1 hypothetical protein vBValMPVA8_85 [Vibrio phage vB_ValM_PVA8]WOL24795.1 hypothetical protein [Vibrio phage PG216]